jgi:hypothetical protein
MSLLGIDVGTSGCKVAKVVMDTATGFFRVPSEGKHRKSRWVQILGSAIFVGGTSFCGLCAAQPLELTKVDPLDYTIVERDRKGSIHDFHSSEPKHGETWVTDLELKSPPVRIPLMREDSSDYSGLGYAGVIDDLNDRNISVTWVVPKVVMLVSWESTLPAGYVSYSGYVLVALTDSKASVLQRVFGTRTSMSVSEERYTIVHYASLGKDLWGHLRIQRTVTKGESGTDPDGSGQWRVGCEDRQTATVYALKKGSLKELSHTNLLHYSWDDKPTSLDEIVNMTWTESKSTKGRNRGSSLAANDEKLRFKKAILKLNPMINNEEDCPLPVVIPGQGRFAIPIEPKGMDYPYDDVVELGWLERKQSQE